MSAPPPSLELREIPHIGLAVVRGDGGVAVEAIRVDASYTDPNGLCRPGACYHLYSYEEDGGPRSEWTVHADRVVGALWSLASEA